MKTILKLRLKTRVNNPMTRVENKLPDHPVFARLLPSFFASSLPLSCCCSVPALFAPRLLLAALMNERRTVPVDTLSCSVRTSFACTVPSLASRAAPTRSRAFPGHGRNRHLKVNHMTRHASLMASDPAGPLASKLQVEKNLCPSLVRHEP